MVIEKGQAGRSMLYNRSFLLASLEIDIRGSFALSSSFLVNSVKHAASVTSVRDKLINKNA